MVPAGDPHATLLLTGGQWGFIAGLLLVGLALKASVVWWLWTDARWRGVDPRPWVVAAVFFDLIALAVWTFARPKVSAARGGHGDLRAAESDPRRYGIEVGSGGARTRPRYEDFLDEERARRARDAPRTAPAAEAEPQRKPCPSCGTGMSTLRGTEGAVRLRCPSCGHSEEG